MNLYLVKSNEFFRFYTSHKKEKVFFTNYKQHNPHLELLAAIEIDLDWYGSANELLEDIYGIKLEYGWQEFGYIDEGWLISELLAYNTTPTHNT